MKEIKLGLAELDLTTLRNLRDRRIKLDDEALAMVRSCRTFLDGKSRSAERTFYGVNTGFGALCHVAIDESELENLQYNLVVSHASGCGDLVDDEIVRLMLVLKINSLAKGHSGIAEQTLLRLCDHFNQDLLAEIPNSGSLGASGDLAPLAHLSLPLLGLGRIRKQGKSLDAASILSELNWEPLHLRSKEGLALLNGTQFMSAFGVWCLNKGRDLLDWSLLIAAMSLDAYMGLTEPFDERIHQLRPHLGQLKVADRMRTLLKGSEIQQVEKTQVQDPYSFRCIPQVLGASMDSMDHVERVLHTEINAVTDNPNIFPEDDAILSGGNFHGQPLAMILEILKLSCAEIGSLAERRTYKLIGGFNGLPSFLSQEAGTHSGLMIPQYTAASLVSRNKQLCSPAIVDTIDSSNGQEDHVSMGANAAVQCKEIVMNLERILAIELLNAAQALDLRRARKSSPIIERLHAALREKTSFISADRPMYEDIEICRQFIAEHRVEEFS